MKGCTTMFGPDVVVVGDPVDVVTGANLDYQTDFTLDGPLPLVWARWYASNKNWVPGGHGWGHAHSFEQRLLFDLDGIRFVSPAAGTIRFPALDKDREFVAVAGFRLRRIDRRNFTLSKFGEPTATFRIEPGRDFAQLVELTNDRGRVEFRYDKEGDLGTIIDSAGRPLKVEHDGAGHVARLSLPGPGGRTRRVADYQYDSAGNLLRFTDPYGNTIRYQFDAENRQVRRTDRRGYSFLFEYDTEGRCTRAGGEDGTQEVKLAYDPAVFATLVTHKDGGQWLYVYDADKVVAKVIAPDGGVQQSVKDSGRIVAEIDAVGRATQRVHDPDGALVGTLDPFGYFHADGGIDFDPHAYAIAANPAERLLGDLAFWTAIELPATGDRAVAALGAAGRFIQTRTPGSPTRSDREKDDFGKLFRESFPDGTSRRWQYDPNGNVAKYTDREGAATASEYSSWNALTQETNAAGHRVRYEYAPSGAGTAVTDAGGSRAEYGYDLQERLVQVRRHSVVRECYEYDLAGNLLSKRDGTGRELVRYEVGPDGLPLAIKFGSGETHTLAYDERGRFLQASTGKHTITFGYTREYRTADIRDGLGVEHQLGTDGLAQTTVFGAFHIGYRWLGPDEYAITDPTGGEHRIRFLSKGLVERTLANGSRELNQFDADGRCLTCVTTGVRGDIRGRVFRYSPEGCLTEVEDSARGSTRYRYDLIHRLAGIDRPDGSSAAIDHDTAGNLTRMPGLDDVSLREGNRLLTANGERFEYDSRNHIASRTGPKGTTRYHYDDNDMLVRVEQPEQPDWTAGYDPFCRRVWKQWGEKRTEYWWDSDRLAAERDETGRLRIYIYADDYAFVPHLFVDYDSAASDPATGRVFTIHTDQIGTPVEVRDAAGDVVWEAEIAPYGAATIRANGIELNLRFPGHYHDPETGLHYNRFRYYAPTLGRYLQSDPIGIGGGLNVYAYPARPLDKVDIRGLSGDDDLTPAQRAAYNQTRGGTPSQARRDDCNQPGSVCAATGEPADPGKRLAADHIVPLKKIVTMPGFTDLSPEQQKAVANNAANFQPLKGGENSSKGSKEVKDWEQCRGEDLDPKKRAEMLKAAKEAEKELQKHIDKMLKDGKEADPRACSGCPKGSA